MGISSLLTQAQRTRVMEQFRADNEKNILVATDVAARGLDIKGVDLVINYELPQDAESYVHRIGRTGRAGAEGQAFSLVSDRDVESLSRIEDYLKHKLEIGWIEDAELIRDFKGLASDEGRHRSFDRDSRGPRQDRGGQRGGGGDRRPRDQRQGGGGRGPRRDDHRRQDGRADQRSASEPRSDQRADSRRPRPEGSHPSGKPSNLRSGPGPKPDPLRKNKPQEQDAKGNGSHRGRRPQPRHPQKDGQQRSHAKPAAKPAPGLLKKVSGFFKKLLRD